MGGVTPVNTNPDGGVFNKKEIKKLIDDQAKSAKDLADDGKEVLAQSIGNSGGMINGLAKYEANKDTTSNLADHDLINAIINKWFNSKTSAAPKDSGNINNVT